MNLAGAARALERGKFDRPVTRAIASLLGGTFARGLVRPEVAPEGLPVVCVGGATLGGSGKTRVAIASAAFLAAEGAKVTLIGHGYRARIQAPRIVGPEDAINDVGDEAIVCARALPGVDVVVGPTRQAAIDFAARRSPDVLVLDGPLAIRSRAISVLAVDALRPWGAGQVVPAGDLRAPAERLLALADHVIQVGALPTRVRWPTGHAPLASLAEAGVGLFTALARPERLIRALSEAGIRPAPIVAVADHGAAPHLSDAIRWVATEKCALHLPPTLEVGILENELDLPGRFEESLRRALTPSLVRP